MDHSRPPHEFVAKLERVYFAYDPESGEVLGTHCISTVRGGELPKDADLERSIRSTVSRTLKGRTGEFGLTFLNGPDFHPRRTYRFDKGSNRIVVSPARGAGPIARNEGVTPTGRPPAALEEGQLWDL